MINTVLSEENKQGTQMKLNKWGKERFRIDQRVAVLD